MLLWRHFFFPTKFGLWLSLKDQKEGLCHFAIVAISFVGDGRRVRSDCPNGGPRKHPEHGVMECTSELLRRYNLSIVALTVQF